MKNTLAAAMLLTAASAASAQDLWQDERHLPAPEWYFGAMATHFEIENPEFADDWGPGAFVQAVYPFWLVEGTISRFAGRNRNEDIDFDMTILTFGAGFAVPRRRWFGLDISGGPAVFISDEFDGRPVQAGAHASLTMHFIFDWAAFDVRLTALWPEEDVRFGGDEADWITAASVGFELIY